MIARHETHMDRMDIWSKLSAPVPAGSISWRQDGKPSMRDGRHFARFVAYVDANTVRERLDTVVPGEWDLTLDLLPSMPGDDGEAACSFKARLQILGVIREDVGTGRDYKSAATDAFKRVAVRFGIAHELYAYEQNWVEVEGDGRHARPLEDPADAYARRLARGEGRASAASHAHAHTAAQSSESAALGPRAMDEPSCPRCGGRMWDNRLTKRNPKAPDYKCRARSCDGVIWPARDGAPAAPAPEPAAAEVGIAGAGTAEEDDLPF